MQRQSRGAPTHVEESDRLRGVWLFKRDYGGVLTWYINAWDYAPFAPLYWLYTQAIPRLRAWLRRKRPQYSSLCNLQITQGSPQTALPVS